MYDCLTQLVSVNSFYLWNVRGLRYLHDLRTVRYLHDSYDVSVRIHSLVFLL